MRVLLINGPNMDRLGKRAPDVYGRQTLADVVAGIEVLAAGLGSSIEHIQSNHEGELLDWLHEREDDADALVINPAGLTEIGQPLRDAILDAGLRVVVVHVSNPAARPSPWKREDIFAPCAETVIAGAGTWGYEVAIRALHGETADKTNSPD